MSTYSSPKSHLEIEQGGHHAGAAAPATAAPPGSPPQPHSNYNPHHQLPHNSNHNHQQYQQQQQPPQHHYPHPQHETATSPAAAGLPLSPRRQQNASSSSLLMKIATVVKSAAKGSRATSGGNSNATNSNKGISPQHQLPTLSKKGIETPPRSLPCLPLLNPNNNKSKQQAKDLSAAAGATLSLSTTPKGAAGAAGEEPKLIHPLLAKIPMQFRFGLSGFVQNVLFMVTYNACVVRLQRHGIRSSTVYSVIYLLFIPIGHAMVSLTVFGWPTHYMSSLASNFPIGLTGIALGGALTAYLDKLEFEEWIEEYIRDNFIGFSKMPARDPLEERSEFYSSLVVICVTGIWTYILSVWINASPQTSEKKEQ